MRRTHEHLDASFSIQVTQSCKYAIERIASEELTLPSVIARQALLDYMRSKYPRYEEYVAQYKPPKMLEKGNEN